MQVWGILFLTLTLKVFTSVWLHFMCTCEPHELHLIVRWFFAMVLVQILHFLRFIPILELLILMGGVGILCYYVWMDERVRLN